MADIAVIFLASGDRAGPWAGIARPASRDFAAVAGYGRGIAEPAMGS